jgi:glycosyltransferase involved in cell wall biosynthesis
VFVLLSRSEALGLVAWEAMYMRCPIVTSAARGFIETLGSGGERGWVIADGTTPEEFENVIVEATNSSTDRDVIIDRAQAYVAQKTQDVGKLSAILKPNKT